MAVACHQCLHRCLVLAILLHFPLCPHGVECPLQGAQQFFPVADLPDGWVLHYDEPYGHATQLANVWPGDGDCLLWGAKASSTALEFALVAFADRRTVETSGVTVFTSGLFWYTHEDHANGFSSLNNIQLLPGDQGPYECANRLSWLLDGSGGYRAGCQLDLDSDADWRKVVMYGPPADHCRASYCSGGFVLREGRPRFCRGRNCTQSECCEERGSCRPSLCTGGFALKVSGTSELCSTSVCTREECCDELPVCSASACPLGHLLKPRDQHPGWCQDRSCAVVECCDPAPRCSNFSCPLGLVHGNTTFCSDWQCQVAECCEDAGLCSSFACPPSMRSKSSGAPTFCGGSSCLPTECCDPNPPNVSVEGTSFTDSDLDEGEIGGILSWMPPELGLSVVSHFTVYMSMSGESGEPSPRQSMGTVAWGTNRLLLPQNIVPRGPFLVYAANQVGEQSLPALVEIRDTVYSLGSVDFTDLDLDRNELGGVIEWEPGARADLVTHHSVYLTPRGDGPKLHLGTTAIGTNQLSVPQNTRLSDVSDIQIFAQSTLGEQTTPRSTSVIDSVASVSDISFVDEDSEPGMIGGEVSWSSPSNTDHVEGYQVYLVANATTDEDGLMVASTAATASSARLPAGTAKGNYTRICVFTVSALGKQSIPSTVEITEKHDQLLLTLTIVVGSAAGLRAVSMVAGASVLATTGVTTDFESLETAPASPVQNPMDVPITDTFVSPDGQQEVVIGHEEAPFVRRLFSMLFPAIVHPHHSRIVVSHDNTSTVLYRHRHCKNFWYSNGMLVKKLANNVISVQGIGEKSLKLKRKRRYCPAPFSSQPAEPALRVCAAPGMLLVISSMIILLNELALGLVVLAATAVSLIVFCLTEPGSPISFFVQAIFNAPPRIIRHHFWVAVGTLVALLPCVPAFLSNTTLGHAVGAMSVAGALLCLLGCQGLASPLEALSGAALSLLALVEQQQQAAGDNARGARVMVVVFASAALLFVKGMDGCVKAHTALYLNIRLPDDPILAAAQEIEKASGISPAGSMYLEAFLQGELEVPMQDSLVRALQLLSYKMSDLCNKVVAFATDDLCADAFKKTELGIEPLFKRMVSLIGGNNDAGTTDVRQRIEELHATMSKLSTRAFGESSSRKCTSSINRLRSACNDLEAALKIVSRAVPVDASAMRPVQATLIGSYTAALASAAQGADFLEHSRLRLCHLQATIEVMQEINLQLGNVFSAATQDGQQELDGDRELPLAAAEAAFSNVDRALQAVWRLVRPRTPGTESMSLGTADLSAVSDWLTDVTEGATVVGLAAQSLQDNGRMQVLESPEVSQSVQERVRLLAPRCRDPTFLDEAALALEAARTVSSISTAALEEVQGLLKRAEYAVEALAVAKTQCQRSAEALRRAVLAHASGGQRLRKIKLEELEERALEALHSGPTLAAVAVSSIASHQASGLASFREVVQEELEKAKQPLARLKERDLAAQRVSLLKSPFKAKRAKVVPTTREDSPARRLSTESRRAQDNRWAQAKSGGDWVRPMRRSKMSTDSALSGDIIAEPSVVILSDIV